MEKTKFDVLTPRDGLDGVHDTKIPALKPRPLDLDPSVYLRNDYVVVDFETTNQDKGSPITRSNNIVLASWIEAGVSAGVGTRPGSLVESHFGNEYEQGRLCEAIRKASFVVAFHAKFECGWFKRCGLELRDLIIYDPMLGEYVLAGNLTPPGGFSLDASLKRYGLNSKMQYVSELIANGVCPSNIPPRELQEYCECDVRQTLRLFLRQRRRIFNARQERVLYGRCLVTPMLADIESRGVYLDNERVQALYLDRIREWRRLDETLQEFTGAVNWNSSKQVAALLYDKLGFEEPKDYRGNVIKTGKGNRSASDPTISQLKPRTTEQRKFQDLWGQLAPLKKEVSILETMKKICEEDDGHFYATFNQAVTRNHRLSCTGGKWGIQLQNAPRSFKKLFRSRSEGRQQAEGDCPQLEFRTVIDLTGDPVGLADVLARADVHTLTSSVTGFSRQDSKPYTFKPIYGGTSGPPRLRKYYDAFRARYRVMYNGQLAWVYTTLVDRQLTTATGLIFYWPDTEVTPSGYITNTTKIFNYPVSCFAGGDIAQLCLVLVWHGLRGWDSYLCNTVHDSGIGDVVQEEACKFEQLMVQSYTDQIYEVLDKLYDYSFHTPLGLGFKIGDHWGEGEERKYEPDKRFKFTSDIQTAITL